MKRAIVAVLFLGALWPVGSASADTVIFKGDKFSLGEAAEASGKALLIPFKRPPAGFDASAGVVLTEDGGTYNSDVIVYSSILKGFIFESATNSSLAGDFKGFTFLNETGKLQKVGQYFGLGDGELRIRSAAATPLPPTWTIMLIGLAGLGFMLYRRERREGVAVMAAA